MALLLSSGPEDTTAARAAGGVLPGAHVRLDPFPERSIPAGGAMKHLAYLKLANTLMAIVMLLAGIMAMLIVAVFVVLMGQQQPLGTYELAVLAGSGFGGFLVCAVSGLVLWLVGRKVAHGRARMLQTLAAVLSLSSFPVGTFYGAYALWVCWFNAETRDVFDSGGLLD